MTTSAHRQQPPGPGPVASYTSPIPIRPATFSDAIASEWTKIRSVRSTVWTLGVLIVLMLTIGVGAALLMSSAETELAGEPVLSLGFFGVLLGSICVITLGVLTIGSEYGTGMIRATLTACPSRGRVLAAKSAVFSALTFVVTTVTAAVVAWFQLLILDVAMPSADLWLRSTAGVGLFMALLGLLSVGVGAIVRHTAGSVTIMIGVVLLPLVVSLFMFADSLRTLQRFLVDYSVPSQLSSLYGVTMTSTGPSGWTPVTLMAGLAAVALGGAYLALSRRDV
ncbi:ABC transporter permease [Streptomyces sp. NPDC101181]|uniref:ABC transporter permease n=1 Tax=Streptomyces sp. NPDC101181 TaxID=3366125 RepID=UPI003809DEE8